MLSATLRRYIAKRIFAGIMIAFLCVVSVIMLVDFVEASRDIGAHDNIGTAQIFWLTLLKTPRVIEQTIPFVVLFGVMGALYSLNKRSELIVLRAAGLSAWRFLTPAIAVSGTIGIVWSLACNPLASYMLSQHDNHIERLTDRPQITASSSLWLREGNEAFQTVIYAKRADVLDHKLYDATFYLFELSSDGKASFERRFDAQEAELLQQGYWQLRGVLENIPGEQPQKQSAISMPTSITYDDLLYSSETPKLPPFWDIPSTISKTEQAGFSTVSLRMQLHKLLVLPIMLIAMTIIAAGVSTRLTRNGSTFRLLVTGGVLGFGVYFADNVVSAFGQATIIPIILAAWAVPLLVLCLGAAYMSYIEDG